MLKIIKILFNALLLASCTMGMTLGNHQSVHQTVTNSVDSVTTIFKLGKP